MDSPSPSPLRLVVWLAQAQGVVASSRSLPLPRPAPATTAGMSAVRVEFGVCCEVRERGYCFTLLRVWEQLVSVRSECWSAFLSPVLLRIMLEM